MAAVVEQPNELNLLNDLIARARAQGADAADAVMVDAVSVSYAQRLGATEKLEREESQDLGLRVLLGPKQAVVSSTDLSAEALEDLVTRALAMAKTVPDDPYCGLAQPDQLATSFPELDGFDAREPATDALIERARACEEAARAVAGVTNSEGAEASWSRSRIAVAGSNGFAGAYRLTRHGIG
ncbi:MAG: PmbA/TldA family metallopeptidase, partial [Alphaproteobacteria bacterium]